MRRCRMRDVEHEIAAAVAVIADMGGAGRNTLDHADQGKINAVLLQSPQQHGAKSIIPDRARKDRASAETSGNPGRLHTPAQHADPVGYREDVLQVVADEDPPPALRLELVDQLDDLALFRYAKGCGGFVHDQ